MPYIGARPVVEFSTIPSKDSFTGDGSTTTFDLATAVATSGENALEVFVNNVRQEPGSGKSFTMQWFAKQAIEHGNLPLVIVTDRRQLDKQIHTTFSQVGYPDPLKADKATDLEKFINSCSSKWSCNICN